MKTWLDVLSEVPGTLVSAGTESIQLYPMGGRIRNLALALAEFHPWIDTWKNMGLRVFCLNEEADIPAGNTGRMLLHESTLKFLASLPQPVHILMFKPDAESTSELEAAGYRVLGSDPVLARRLENKMIFPSIAQQAGVKIPETRELLIGADVQNSTNALPMCPSFICQFAKGFSGNRTFLIRSVDDWQAVIARFAGRRCRVSRWTDGDTWTANGCIFRDGDVIVTYPFLQETRVFQPADGLPPRIGSRGNRWGHASYPFLDSIREVMMKLGKVLHAHGFLGFFGADLIISPDNQTVLAVEINPRITASAPVLTPLEMSDDTPPLIASHIAASLNLDWQWREMPVIPPAGGQLIFRPDGTLVPEILLDCKPGIYNLGGLSPEYLRDHFSPADLQTGEAIIWKPLTSNYSSEIMRIIYRGDPGSLLNEDSGQSGFHDRLN